MAEHYSRQSKPHQKGTKTAPTQHIAKGFSALQKTIALIGGTLGIITALITIHNFQNSGNNSNSQKIPRQQPSSKLRMLTNQLPQAKAIKQALLLIRLLAPMSALALMPTPPQPIKTTQRQTRVVEL
ncbi:DUF6556 family protein [Streptococcus sp. DD12]|uniref:DUF6556 family protein n=1 Tax=Streptococcus sp. DD12 TaxID=1777880 RepID=UPI0007929CD4|nr:DUF6556 family protein [Streptococcus sp. DD12]KXT76163.1 putative histone acetyltransferase Gcn5 [Streptococcus sp. DD12]